MTLAASSARRVLDRLEVADDVVDLDQVVDPRPRGDDGEAVEQGGVLVADREVLLQLEADELLAARSAVISNP